MARYIKRNHSTRTPTNIMIVDTETRSESNDPHNSIGRHTLFLGCCKRMRLDNGIVSRESDHMFRTREQFWKLVADCQSDKHPLVIYTHNAGFDSTILGYWEMVRKGIINIKYCVTESPPTILIGWYKGLLLKWYDSLNWFRCSLDELGKSLGMRKLPMPSDYESIVEWTSYCFNDVEILAKAIVNLYQFVRENDLGVLRPTVGSQSLQTYRHKFSKTQEIFRRNEKEEGDELTENDIVNVITPHSNQEVIALERRSYFHADRWIYQVGKIEIATDEYSNEDEATWYTIKEVSGDGIFRLDVNSLFPSVMSGSLFPARLFDVAGNCCCRDIVRMSQDYGVISEVQIDCDTMPYPIRWRGSSIQVTGRYWTTLAGPELLAAISRGHVRCIGKSAFYHMEELFTDYVAFFSRKRQEYREKGNFQFANLCKDMNTNLYGKFAQLSGKWTNVDNVERCVDWGDFIARNPDTGKYETYRAIDGIVQQYRRQDLADHTFFAIPSYVTSYAREYMRKLIAICGEENMYYTYIDSIHCNRNGFDRLKKAGMIHQHEMGKLKIEEVTNAAEYRNIGDYSFGRHVKITGVSRSATQTGDSEYRVKEFEKLDTVIQRGGEAHIAISEVTKTLDRRLTCGDIADSGRTVRLHLERPKSELRNVLETQGDATEDS